MDVDLSLPDPPRERRVLPLLTLAAVLACVGLLLFGKGTHPGPAPDSGAAPLYSTDLAQTLEKRTLYGPAAGLWEEVAKQGGDRATPLFRAGRCRMLAGEPGLAVRDFLAAEALGLPEELAAESSRHVLECLASMGKFAERDAELRARTGSTEEEGAEIVARVGEDPVTRADLNAAVRDEEAGKLMARGDLDANALDRAVAARLADPASLLPILKAIATRQALALAAEKEGLASTPDFSRRFAGMRQALLAEMLTRKRFFADVAVTDRELRDHFAAHRDRYVRPVAVRFSWGPAQAAPEELAKVEAWHEAGAPWPEDLGRSAEADAMLLAMKPGEIADRPVEIGGRAIRLRLDERRGSEDLTFDAARERVAEDLRGAKRMEAIRALQEEVARNHPVTVEDPALRSAWEAKGAAGGK